MDEEELMLLFLFILLCHRFNIMLTRLRKPGRGRGFRLVCPHHFTAIFRPREKHVYSVVPG